MKTARIHETKTGKYQICVDGEAPGSVMGWNIFENLPDAEIALDRTLKSLEKRAIENQKRVELARLGDQLERYCSTPIRVSRQLKLQQALRDAYQGVCIAGRRAASYERYHGGNDRYLDQICNANEEAESSDQIYKNASNAHHLAAVARRSGNGDAWDTALDVMESELKKFDRLAIYGIAKLDLEVADVS